MTGRPSDISKVVAIADDGHEITVADRVVQGVRIGGYVEPAAKSAGISKDTVYEWKHVAGRLRIVHGPGVEAAELTDYQRACLAFSDAIERAEAEWEMDKLATLERLERGGVAQEIITEKTDADGNVTERTVRKSATLPDANVILRRLKLRFPDRYREQVEVSGDLGVHQSDEERASALVDTIDAYLKGVEDAKPKPRRKRKAPEPGPAI